MFSAIGRLLIILVSTLLVAILAIFGLRSLGQTGRYSSPFEDAFYTSDPWFVVFNDWTPHDLRSAAKTLPESVIFGAEVQVVGSGEYIIHSENYIFHDNAPRFLMHMDLTEALKLKPGLLTLTGFLQEAADRSIFLRLKHLNRVTGARLVEIIKANKTEGRILLQAANQSLKKLLKEKDPLWIFANTSSELGRLKVFAALGLESLIRLDADVYVLDQPSERLEAEVHRRKRRILIESSLENASTHADSGVIVTARPDDIPNELLRRVDSH